MYIQWDSIGDTYISDVSVVPCEVLIWYLQDAIAQVWRRKYDLGKTLCSHSSFKWSKVRFMFCCGYELVQGRPVSGPR